MPPIDVAAGLVFQSGLILITRRPPGKHLAGLWEFPGGKLHPGEDWETALRRELVEELDLNVTVGALYAEIIHPYPDRTVRLRFHLCTPLPPSKPRAIECDAFAWVARSQLSEHRFPAADTQLLQRLESDPALWLQPHPNISLPPSD